MLDTLSFDDLYNNQRVFKRNVKGTTASSSNTQNVAFVSAENTSSTNDVSTAYSVSSHSISKSQKEGSSSYTDEVIHSFFANQSSDPQLDYDDLGQINDDDMEEMDLKWQVAMISMRIKKFHKRTGRKFQFDTKDPIGFDKTKVKCFNCHKMRHFARDYRAKGNQDNRRRDAGFTGKRYVYLNTYHLPPESGSVESKGLEVDGSVGMDIDCASSWIRPTFLAAETNILSNNGVTTSEKPVPTFFILANTFFVREGLS
uniref:Ribonuclease H-like domain-containing protein n=1 Tax=Tanacetum cinerariifolium TaxID=118510 RepID=A0A6L2NM25_TANCI|nr:ribonuclease H-like domain-containing protein [Tanacetum cinerariifolium]